LRLNWGSFTTDARLRQPFSSLRGRVLGGCRGRLAVPRGDQLCLNLGPLRRRQFRLSTIPRHIMNRKVGASAGVPASGKSAIDTEQPPSASADNSSAPKANALFLRSTDMRPEIPTSPS